MGYVKVTSPEGIHWYLSAHFEISKNTGRSAFPLPVREYSTCGGISLNCKKIYKIKR